MEKQPDIYNICTHAQGIKCCLPVIKATFRSCYRTGTIVIHTYTFNLRKAKTQNTF